jgi:Ca-activated chloride channel family protein
VFPVGIDPQPNRLEEIAMNAAGQIAVRFADPRFLWLLLIALPALAGLFYWSWRVKQTLIRLFISSRLLPDLLVGVSPRRQLFRLALLAAALTGVLLALARPQWGFAWEQAKQKGLDIIVAMDTSRSMLAQDAAPNRLEKAKLAVLDLVRQARSDRLGLVAFAGTAFLQTPLTLDDQAFRQGVEALNAGIIAQGGTALSAAIRAALTAFEKGEDNHKVLVLFTDGEDHDAEGDTLAAAKEAAQAGMRIFTVGVGTAAGELLRVRDDQGNYSFVKDEDGNVVKSHLNEKLLRQIATEANGFYLPLQGADPMATLYARGLAPLPKTDATTRLTRVYQERYHWFLAFAVACLLLEFLLPESSRSRRANGTASPARAALQKTAAALCFLLAAWTARASPSSAFRDYQSGDYKGAFDEYNRLSQQNTNDYRLHYDAGAAAYGAKQLDKAEKQFNATLASPGVVPDLLTQEHTYYNLGNTLYRLGEPLPEPDKKEERWNQAIDSYTQALRLNTNDADAKNNLAYVKQKLEELKRQEQQQQQQNKQQQNQKNNQDQQKQQDQQNQQQQNQQQQSAQQNQQNGPDKKQEEKKRQQEQAKKDQEKQQQQAQAAQGEQKEPQPQEGQQVAAGQMTPEEARELLAEQKDDEKTLIFAPENQPVKTQTGKIKDW